MKNMKEDGLAQTETNETQVVWSITNILYFQLLNSSVPELVFLAVFNL